MWNGCGWDKHGEDDMTHFHVSPDGRDAWSGRLREPNAARTDGPFAGLARARDAVRAMKNAAGLRAQGVNDFGAMETARNWANSEPAA